jgi:hypothetical protein
MGVTEDYCLLRCDIMYPSTRLPVFQRNMLPPSSGGKKSGETSMKAGGKQSNPPARLPGYIENRREVEEWNLVPTGSSIGPNETANNHWLHE